MVKVSVMCRHDGSGPERVRALRLRVAKAHGAWDQRMHRAQVSRITLSRKETEGIAQGRGIRFSLEDQPR